MGQIVGKAKSFDPAVEPFLNLPAPAINRLWTSFNLSAETWGLTMDPFVTICAELARDLGLEDLEMRSKVRSTKRLSHVRPSPCTLHAMNEAGGRRMAKVRCGD